MTFSTQTIKLVLLLLLQQQLLLLLLLVLLLLLLLLFLLLSPPLFSIVTLFAAVGIFEIFKGSEVKYNSRSNVQYNQCFQ